MAGGDHADAMVDRHGALWSTMLAQVVIVTTCDRNKAFGYVTEHFG
jgi:hypothetical protein